MRRTVSLLGAVAVLASCTDAPAPASAPDGTLTIQGVTVSTQHNANHVSAQATLTGDQEVPPRATPAHGNAVVHLKPKGDGLEYLVIANQIDNVVQAHIHLHVCGQNGNIVAWLFPNPQATVPLTPPGLGPNHIGILARGVITAADLRNDLAGEPISALVQAIKDGRTYVNVHTNDGVGATNTGPGDFPGGEIRGQLSDPSCKQ